MKETYEKYIVYGLLVLVVFILIFAMYSFSRTTGTTERSTGTNNAGENTENTLDSISSGSTGSGDASIELTPYEMKGNQLIVKIAVNTHSVDLTQFDLMQLTTLEYNGKTIKPISAPKLTGHHTSGELMFNVGEKIDSFKIIIKGIPNIESREFRW